MKRYQSVFAAVVVCWLGAGCNAPASDVPGVDLPVDSTEPQLPADPGPITRTDPETVGDPVGEPTGTPELPTPTPTEKPLALVYAGPGVLYGDDDTLALAEVVAAKAGFEVKEVTGYQDAATMARAKVWIQPGGPNLRADKYMNNRGMDDQVREFIKNGGGYVGFCGGAFSAANNLGIVPGSAWGYGASTGKIAIKWLGKTRYFHYEHGPYINLSGVQDPLLEIVGTYPSGAVAAVRTYYGKGKVFITGFHPEASATWPPYADPDGLDHDIAVEMIREVARP